MTDDDFADAIKALAPHYDKAQERVGMSDSVRDLLIERIARYDVDMSDGAMLHDTARYLAAELLDAVFCDPEIREAMVEPLVWRMTNLHAAPPPSKRDGKSTTAPLPVMAAYDYLIQLFGPVKEKEQ